MPGPAAHPCLGAAKSARSEDRLKSAKLYPGKASRPLLNAVAERLNACLRLIGFGKRCFSASIGGAVGASGLVPARPDFGSGRGFISTILKSPILVCGSCRQ